MNCFATTKTALGLIHTIVVGEKLVLYPYHIRRNTPQKWGKSHTPIPEEHTLLRGDSPIFVEVKHIHVVCFPDYSISNIEFRHLTPVPNISTKLSMCVIHTHQTDFMSCIIKWDDYVSRIPDIQTTRTINLTRVKIGVIRCDILCANILAAHQRHTERAMMREIFAKKMGDARAVDVIAREFFPLV